MQVILAHTLTEPKAHSVLNTRDTHNTLYICTTSVRDWEPTHVRVRVLAYPL